MEYSAADPYEVLGVPRDATPGVLRAHYRRALLACHPDGSGNGDPAQVEAVKLAYDTITDRLAALESASASTYPAPVLGDGFRSPAKSPRSALAAVRFLWPAAAVGCARAGVHLAGFGWNWVLSVVGVAVATVACLVGPAAQRRNAAIAVVMATIDVTYSVLPIILAVLAFAKDRGRE